MSVKISAIKLSVHIKTTLSYLQPFQNYGLIVTDCVNGAHDIIRYQSQASESNQNANANRNVNPFRDTNHYKVT